ncbi:MAG: hypothetical protein ACU0CA_14325 [Paracoccaceae bacterium]
MTRTNRRRVLTGTALAPLAAPALSAPAKPVDPIVGWFEEWQITETDCDQAAEDSPTYHVALEERDRLGLLICNATATTIEGASAQFQWLEACFGYIFRDQLGGGFDDSFPNIGRSLKALAG